MRALLLKWGTSATAAEATDARISHGSRACVAEAMICAPLTKLLFGAASERRRHRVRRLDVRQRPSHARGVVEVADHEARPASLERERALGARVANESSYGFARVEQRAGYRATVHARRTKHESRHRRQGQPTPRPRLGSIQDRGHWPASGRRCHPVRDLR